MLTELYSFNWYAENSNKLFPLICRAVTRADLGNKCRLQIAYPEILEANYMRNWDAAPNYKAMGLEPSIDGYDYKTCSEKQMSRFPSPGSFNYYLSIGGGFVKSTCQIIMHSKSLRRIKKAYPQMVAAYKMDCWDDSPEGFEFDVYDSYLVKKA